VALELNKALCTGLLQEFVLELLSAQTEWDVHARPRTLLDADPGVEEKCPLL
jgi:hypothetical protein